MSRAGLWLAAVLALATGATTGCTSTHYDWASYEKSIYRVTSTPDGFDLQAEIDALEKQLEISANHDRLPPPGLHAHLGYLHSVAGNLEAAKRHFENEKKIYPESTRFMDNLLARITVHG